MKTQKSTITDNFEGQFGRLQIFWSKQAVHSTEQEEKHGRALLSCSASWLCAPLSRSDSPVYHSTQVLSSVSSVVYFFSLCSRLSHRSLRVRVSGGVLPQHVHQQSPPAGAQELQRSQRHRRALYTGTELRSEPTRVTVLSPLRVCGFVRSCTDVVHWQIC